MPVFINYLCFGHKERRSEKARLIDSLKPVGRPSNLFMGWNAFIVSSAQSITCHYRSFQVFADNEAISNHCLRPLGYWLRPNPF